MVSIGEYVWGAFNLFVAVLLAMLSAALVLAPRRARASAVLGVFLGLVALNYAGISLAFFTDEGGWAVAAYVALALDPLVLLLFVHLYPFERLGSRVRIGLALAAAAALASIVIIVAWPAETVYFFIGTDARSWQRFFVLGTLGTVYAAAWLSSLHALAEAPTESLRRRAAWATAAIGVTTLPRIALLAEDWSLWIGSLVLDATPHLRLAQAAAMFLQSTVTMGIVCAIAWTTVAARRGRRGARTQVLLVARAVAALFALVAILAWWRYYGGPVLGTSAVYALRWMVFVPLLVQGILRYEFISLDAVLQRWIPRYVALAGFVGGTLVAGSRYAGAGPLGFDQALAVLGIGLGTALVAAAASRPVSVRLLRRRPVGGGEGARLDLYRAAVEAAYARGEPGLDVRRRLDRQRRALNVLREEALAVEHLVARSLAAPPRPLQPNDEPVPGLVIERLMGEGSEGRVLLARRLPRGTHVLVKELRPEAGSRPLRWELDRLRRVDHRALPKLLETHFHGETALLLFEYVPGRTLEERLAQGRAPPAEAARWLGGALEPLGWLHGHGMLHRDLKPAHLLMAPDGRVHLLDLGLLAPTVDARERSTIRGLGEHGMGPVGTPGYMAPEVARGEASTARSDLYALGLIAYRMLTGRAAIDVRGLDRRAALDVLAQPRVDLRAAPAAWRPWLRRALHPEAAQRFADADEMRAALPEASTTPRKGPTRQATRARPA